MRPSSGRAAASILRCRNIGSRLLSLRGVRFAFIVFCRRHEDSDSEFICSLTGLAAALAGILDQMGDLIHRYLRHLR